MIWAVAAWSREVRRKTEEGVPDASWLGRQAPSAALWSFPLLPHPAQHSTAGAAIALDPILRHQ